MFIYIVSNTLSLNSFLVKNLNFNKNYSPYGCQRPLKIKQWGFPLLVFIDLPLSITPFLIHREGSSARVMQSCLNVIALCLMKTSCPCAFGANIGSHLYYRQHRKAPAGFSDSLTNTVFMKCWNEISISSRQACNSWRNLRGMLLVIAPLKWQLLN